jgi:general stress protein YciG
MPQPSSTVAKRDMPRVRWKPHVRRKPYIFDHYVFVRRCDDCPTIWLWEIRCKSKPDQRSICESGFGSARDAERAGKLALEIVRQAAASSPLAVQCKKVARPVEKKRPPLTPEQRSENARKAAFARAQSLPPERRAEIGRKGGHNSKGKAKFDRKTGLPIRRNQPAEYRRSNQVVD